MKEKINQLDLIKIKNFCSAGDNVMRMRTQATDREKIPAKTHSIKDYYPKHTKNS